MSFHSTIHTELGIIRAVASQRGLTALVWQQQPFDDDDVPNDVSRETISQLHDYLTGNRYIFTIAYDFSAFTPSYQRWLEVMAQIPYGQTVTYADFAEMWGNRKASRAAGQACQRNHLPILFPCHRVISSGGGLNMYSGGDRTRPTDPDNLLRKQWLIDLERRNRQTV